VKRIRVGYCSAGKARRVALAAERPTARKAQIPALLTSYHPNAYRLSVAPPLLLVDVGFRVLSAVTGQWKGDERFGAFRKRASEARRSHHDVAR